MGAFFPGFAIQPSTVVLGLGIALGVGLVSGIVPAWRASRMRCIEALGATE
jgi:ABC-type antimicrobial peptide transport system permease subunit